MESQTEAFFSDFYQKWMAELEGLLTHLLNTSIMNPSLNPAAYAAAIEKFTSHHREYYATKWAVLHDDPMAFFNPIWLSPFESAHLWVSGWRPSTALNLLMPDSFSGLTEAQLEKISCLRAKVKLEEEKVEREMERQHLGMTAMKTGRHGAGGGGGSANGGSGSVGLVQETAAGSVGLVQETAAGSVGLVQENAAGSVGLVQETAAGLEKVIRMADFLRWRSTLKGVLGVLSPMQSVQFFTELTMLQIRTRELGKEMENKN